MRKILFSAVLCVVLLLASCVSVSALRGGYVVRGELPKPSDIASYYSNETIVYVTKSGTRYHKEGCAFLKSSKIMISLEQAKKEGLAPCSRCHPPE